MVIDLNYTRAFSPFGLYCGFSFYPFSLYIKNKKRRLYAER